MCASLTGAHIFPAACGRGVFCNAIGSFSHLAFTPTFLPIKNTPRAFHMLLADTRQKHTQSPHKGRISHESEKK